MIFGPFRGLAWYLNGTYFVFSWVEIANKLEMTDVDIGIHNIVTIGYHFEQWHRRSLLNYGRISRRVSCPKIQGVFSEIESDDDSVSRKLNL